MIPTAADSVEETTSVNGDSKEEKIVTKEGDVRIFDEEIDESVNEASYSSTTFIGIIGMVVCFLCFGVLMFVHSRRKREANEMVIGISAEVETNQEMTLIHVDNTVM